MTVGTALFAAAVAINHGSNNKHQSSAASVVSASTFITALASDQPPIYLCITSLSDPPSSFSLLCLCASTPAPSVPHRRGNVYTALPFATLSDVTLDVRKCPYANGLVNYLDDICIAPFASTLIN